MTERKGLLRAGFTLVELLIVIAILGTLAVVVLIALNPVQQLARTRDAGRSSTVTQLGRAMEAYATARGGEYPDVAGGDCGGGLGSWIDDCLVASGEINNAPDSPAYSSGTGSDCSAGQDGICYNVGGAGSGFVIYMQAEADTNTSQCPTTAEAYFIYASGAGRGGLYCTGGGVPTASGFSASNFVQ